MIIKSYRGLIADGGILEINLRTTQGKIGYKINKFEVIGPQPSALTQESTVKGFKTAVTTATDTIDLGDQDLIAVAYAESYAAATYHAPVTIIFENEIFNQNIYVTHQDANNAGGCNFYLELEQIKLDDNESTMATLQSLRNRYESFTPAGPS